MFCRNPNCQYRDHGGSVGTPCPGCGHPIGYEPTDQMVREAQKRPTKPRMRSANPSVAGKDWRYFKVVDRTTPRNVTFLCRAASADDARGLVKKLYRQQGWRYNADSITIGESGSELPIGSSLYYKWQGSGPTKQVVAHTIHNVPALK